MNNQTIRELRAIAKERGLRGYSKLRKAELVSLLETSPMRPLRVDLHNVIEKIIEMCEEWGVESLDATMACVAEGGRIDIVELCKDCGAKDFHAAMSRAASKGHIEIVKLCRGWLGYDSIHHDLLRHLHKRSFLKRFAMECCLSPGILIDFLTGVWTKRRKDFWKGCGKRFESVALANSKKREKLTLVGI